MRKGKVISTGLSHVNGQRTIVTGEKVTENDVHDFEWAVKTGHILEEKTKVEPKKEDDSETKTTQKVESKPEPTQKTANKSKK